ncbi:MAG: hypothetical protein N2506_00975 [Dehalococcoidales bacterium]|nr:hypothetical protein [Dehalococcoidales bacterium]
MVKVVISFCSGVVVCILLLFTVKLVMPAFAAAPENGPSANKEGLSSLVPDIEGIYRKALVMPFEEAEKKITDPDIAAYYGKLLDETGLRSQK